jgi:hypothetical protein
MRTQHKSGRRQSFSERFTATYQIAIQIPAGIADGDYPIVATLNGVGSPPSLVVDRSEVIGPVSTNRKSWNLTVAPGAEGYFKIKEGRVIPQAVVRLLPARRHHDEAC